MSFDTSMPLEQRLNESNKIRNKYPDMIPVIAMSDPTQVKIGVLPQLEKNKFLVPKDITLGAFIFIIRKRLKLKPDAALFCFIKDSILPTGSLMSMIYDEYKSEDNFLYLTITTESTFGHD